MYLSMIHRPNIGQFIFLGEITVLENHNKTTH